MEKVKPEEYRPELLPVTVTFRLEDGELIHDGLINKLRQDEFMKNVKEGDRISMMLELVNIDGTHAQNNYFHKLCRTISEDTGQGMEDIKRIVKERTGCWKNKKELKSIGDYSKQEMSIAINEAIELGSELGINLHAI